MSGPPKPYQYYFSTYHLARDFIWSVSTFSLFLVLGSILFSPIRDAVLTTVKSLNGLTASLGVLGLGLYALICAASGMIAHRVITMLRDLACLIPGVRDRVGFRFLYLKRKGELQAIYDHYFESGPTLSVGTDLAPTEMVNRLATYMKLYNPQGYSHMYRFYSIVEIFRHFMFYTLVLLAGAIYLDEPRKAIALLFLLVTCFGALRSAVEHAVAAEYDFIVATAQWIKKEKVKGGGPG